MNTGTPSDAITGRCYCGARQFVAEAPPQIVSYCHCIDCRRSSGAPVAAFAGFAEGSVTFSPDEGRTVQAHPDAQRSFCPDCGTPLTGRYAYLPGQVYIALGIIDQADRLAPQRHAHYGSKLSWLHFDDDLPRDDASARDTLKAGD